MEDKKASVIILTYNAKSYLRECLDSLERQTYNNYEVVVVDNASSDGTPRLIKKEFPAIKIIQNQENIGFAKGNNIGIRYVLQEGAAEYIILLNQDTVVEENFLQEGIRLLKVKDIGIVSPKIKFYNSNLIWFGGGKLLRGKELFSQLTFKIAFNLGKFEEDKGQFGEIKEVDSVTGCALFTKREVLEEVGLLDERFFFYGEDTEWCLRCGKAGYKIYFTPGTTVFHKASEKENLKRGFSKNLVKRRFNYLCGVVKIVNKHFKLYEKFIWLIKLPLVFIITLMIYIWRAGIYKRPIS